MLGLNETELSTLREVFTKFDAIEKVILFGSRARGTHQKASDVDLAVKGKNINLNTLAKLKYTLEEKTNLPYFFDVVIYDKIKDDALKRAIDKGGVRMYIKINISIPDSNAGLTQEWFDAVALHVMNNYQLRATWSKETKKVIYDFSELEIYASYKTKIGNDPFCHYNKQQLENNGCFYHHYSGADIVCGDKEKEFYCGILIRGVESETTKEWIYGPGRVAYPKSNTYAPLKLELIKKEKTVWEFVNGLIPVDTIMLNKIFRLPRYNLSIQKINKECDQDTLNWFNRPIRYVRLPNDFTCKKKNELPEEYRLLVRTYFKSFENS